MTSTTVTIHDAQKNLKRLTANVIDNDEHVIITKPKNRNVVMISEAEFRSWQATHYTC